MTCNLVPVREKEFVVLAYSVVVTDLIKTECGLGVIPISVLSPISDYLVCQIPCFPAPAITEIQHA